MEGIEDVAVWLRIITAENEVGIIQTVDISAQEQGMFSSEGIRPYRRHARP
jgi:hypothetical protein